ncbi:MAG: hypothetical protein Q7S61_04160 [bacterium]|nr:hypothetical protein [bacterium]
MKEFSRKIDAHGHFGNSFLGPESRMEDYLPEARRIGVVGTIVSPGPTPEIITAEGIYYPCLWRRDEMGKMTYFSQWSNPNGQVLRTKEAIENPYKDVNELLFRRIQKLNSVPSIFVMPIHHPKLDTAPGLKETLREYPTVALKIHGISTFTGPEDVPDYTIDILKAEDKPLVVHTDMYRGKITHDVHEAYRLNDPVKWVEWSQETGVRTLITHGARLSDKAIQLASRAENIVIGIAPDILLMSEPDRLAYKPDNYLEALLAMVPADKLVYDIDFGWNVSERNQWETLDWQMHERIIEAGYKIGLTDRAFEDIFFNNAVEFYNL